MNPEKYRKQAEFNKAKTERVHWDIKKILFMNGMAH
jgi:hypothetical protein